MFSNILEKIIYDRTKPIIEKNQLMPDHKFGFRNKHCTIERTHRLVNEILQGLETKQYCTLLFTATLYAKKAYFLSACVFLKIATKYRCKYRYINATFFFLEEGKYVIWKSCTREEMDVSLYSNRDLEWPDLSMKYASFCNRTNTLTVHTTRLNVPGGTASPLDAVVARNVRLPTKRDFY